MCQFSEVSNCCMNAIGILKLNFNFVGAAVRVEGCSDHMFTGMTPKEQCAKYNSFVNSTGGCSDPILGADFQSVSYEVSDSRNKVINSFIYFFFFYSFFYSFFSFIIFMKCIMLCFEKIF